MIIRNVEVERKILNLVKQNVECFSSLTFFLSGVGGEWRPLLCGTGTTVAARDSCAVSLGDGASSCVEKVQQRQRGTATAWRRKVTAGAALGYGACEIGASGVSGRGAGDARSARVSGAGPEWRWRVGRHRARGPGASRRAGRARVTLVVGTT